MDDRFEYRGQKTFIILLVLRLMPGFFVLLATIAAGILYSPFIDLVKSRSTTAFEAPFSPAVVWGGGLLLTLIITGLGLLFALLDYYGLRFAMDDHGFRIKTGIFNLREFSIPYRQILNVDISRPLIYRFLGVSKMIIMTGGHEDTDVPEHESEGILDLMDKQTAMRMQLEIMHRSHVQVVAETVNNPHE